MYPKIDANRPRFMIKIAWITFSLATVLLLILNTSPNRDFNTKPIPKTDPPNAQGLLGENDAAGSIQNIVSQVQPPGLPVGPEAPAHQGSEPAKLGLPTRLTIPGIHVDAAVIDVGTTPQGAMDVPKGPDDVAWFELGSRPGQIGTAVMAGHEGWKDGIPAVFDDLHTLKKGDTIYVQDDKGATAAFVVREFGTYEEGRDAPGVFASSDGRSHLNLITCEGVWNKVAKSYSDRLVVFTDKQAE